MSSLEAKVPASAAWLGAAGAIPFVTFAAATPFLVGENRVSASHALLTYGAVILSFLGGIHWGLAIAEPRREKLLIRLVVSVVPSLIGWAALLIPIRTGLYMLAAAVAAMMLVDLRATRLGEAPPWYPRLRLPLTAVVVASLLLSTIA